MEKLNIAELLKDCPKGMELDCMIYDNIVFDSVSDWVYPIRVTTKDRSKILNLTKYGCNSENENAKCVIFPKGKTTWEGFQRPFKDGDIVFYNDTIAIFKEWDNEISFRTYVTKYLCCDSLIDINTPLFGENVRKEIRFATEEEKEKLFYAIKAFGYKWNPEIKTLEKLIEPKFKVGDRVKHKDGYFSGEVTKIDSEYFILKYDSDAEGFVDIRYQDDYELVSNKFDITTLKPFESRVLVRSGDNSLWKPAIFGCYVQDTGFFALGGTCWMYCIPYENNQHLLATNNDCDEYYKTWE